MVTNPVNSTVPVAAQALRKAGAFDPARLFGVTTFDVVRALTFAADALGSNDPGAIKVPVIGGHSDATTLPLYSQAQPLVDLKGEQLAADIHRESIISQSMAISNMNIDVQFGGDEIVKSKQGAGSATTCMTYASFRYIKGIVTAKSGTRVIEEAYVYLPGIPGGKGYCG